MKRMTSGCVCASFRMFSSRSSNSPRYFVPPVSAPIFSSTIRLPARTSGSFPSTTRTASASTTAVLPTPASPTRTGLFFDVRARVWMICRQFRATTDERTKFAFPGCLGKVTAVTVQVFRFSLEPAWVLRHGLLFGSSSTATVAEISARASPTQIIQIDLFRFQGGGDDL